MSDMKIFIAGSTGMVGRSLVKRFTSEGSLEVLTSKSKDLDLLNKSEVLNFFIKHKPDVVIDAAAKVGGIYANSTKPVDFLIDNLTIQNNLMTSAHQIDCSKFIFLSSSCVYPKLAQQPIKEKYLLTGELEKTNQAYAIAKIAGMKLLESYQSQYDRKWFSVMPTNLYGEFDNFSLDSSHVLPAMIRKFHEAKINNDDVVLWGDGTPLREFLHVNDLADAHVLGLEYLLNGGESEVFNLGNGNGFSVREVIAAAEDVTGMVISVQECDRRIGDPPALIGTSEKARKILNWQPQYPGIKDIVSHAWQWHQTRHK
jgi:GDP-L-fucose synthase